MALNCCIEPQRREKTERIMAALSAGTGGRLCLGAPPSLDEPFVVWGHRFLSERLIPQAVASGTPWWFIDNGYHLPARGGVNGYYSLTYRGLAPVMLHNPDMSRLRVEMAPWRPKKDGYVLVALPGPYYGQMLGLDMAEWSRKIRAKIVKRTKRRVIVRDKACRRPLSADLSGASVVVTHSSKAAVDAVVAGVPAIVAPTNPAAPVSSTSLDDIENPKMPDRAHWWASLMCQQFAIREMRDGTAQYWMDAVKEQSDAAGQVSQGFRLEAEAGRDARLQGGIRASCDDALCASCHCQGSCRGRQNATAKGL